MSAPSSHLEMIHDSLLSLLQRIHNHPTVREDADLHRQVSDAISFSQELASSLQPLLLDNREMARQIVAMTAHPNATDVDQPNPYQDRYRAFRDAGAPPEMIDAVAKREEIDVITRIRGLRELFHLDLDAAQNIVTSNGR